MCTVLGVTAGGTAQHCKIQVKRKWVERAGPSPVIDDRSSRVQLLIEDSKIPDAVFWAFKQRVGTSSDCNRREKRQERSPSACHCSCDRYSLRSIGVHHHVIADSISRLIPVQSPHLRFAAVCRTCTNCFTAALLYIQQYQTKFLCHK